MRKPGRMLSLRDSLPAKLALVAVIFVVAIGTVRIFSLDRLAHVDAVSAEIRNRWLDSIHILGNLNDRISDVRTAEAEILLSRDAAARDARSEEVRRSLDLVTQGIDRYRSVPHDADELLAFDTFLQRWTEHIQDAQTIASLVQSGQAGEAISRFDGGGRSSFEAADEGLTHVTDLTVTKAEVARNAAVQAIARAQRWVSDLILATLLLFVALAFYLWRSVSLPLLNLADLMRQLASHDTNFSIPFENRRDEIGNMARSLTVFRRNTIELLESRKSLSRQAEVLLSALEKERALAAEQRNFISTTSHEFRTPLSSIDGHAQRLIATKSSANPADIAARATKIRLAVFRMTSLVASLTNAMELTHGPIHPRTRRFDLAIMLRDLARYYREIGIACPIEEQIGDLPVEVTGDPELLYHTFSNLISNAAKYSPENGTVILNARAKDGWIEVTVEDHGLGIPAADIDRVRERYYRGSNVGSVPGTGVGLHVVDKIVHEHGGRLEIDSEVEKGTRVTVILPIESQLAELQA